MGHHRVGQFDHVSHAPQSLSDNYYVYYVSRVYLWCVCVCVLSVTSRSHATEKIKSGSGLGDEANIMCI